MRLERFEACISEALLAIPQHIRKRMDNVAIVVEMAARKPTSAEDPIHRGSVLLGLYEGIPLIHRGAGYSGVLPDKITIFKQPIEELAGGNDDAAAGIIRDTVLHEVAHHLGMDEGEVRHWERNRTRRNRQEHSHRRP